MRWGATGFEASLFDVDPFGQTPTLNPSGAPVWRVGQAYNFSVTFLSSTGTLGLAIDFNGDQSFGAGESITRNAFAAPSLTSYVGYGFKHFEITGNESGSTARSTITNLSINGTSVANLAPAGGFLSQYYTDPTVNATGDFTVTGALTFTTAGTNQERPSWNFNFRDVVDAPGAPVSVPEPASFALLGMGIALIAARRLRRS